MRDAWRQSTTRRESWRKSRLRRIRLDLFDWRPESMGTDDVEPRFCGFAGCCAAGKLKNVRSYQRDNGDLVDEEAPPRYPRLGWPDRRLWVEAVAQFSIATRCIGLPVESSDRAEESERCFVGPAWFRVEEEQRLVGARVDGKRFVVESD